jgi:hypothetical protein
MKDTKHVARQEILHWVLSFSVANRRSKETKECWATEPFFSSEFSTDGVPPIGTIVILTAAPPSKYTIGWLREIRERGGREYLIESLEDGSMCWWGNVGIKYMDPEEVKQHPGWAMTDRQWKFKKLWDRVCYKEKDAYIYPPLFPRFGEGFEVTLGVRTRWSLDGGATSTQTFPDWRKVTRAMMGKCYDECSRLQAIPGEERKRIESEDAILAATVGKP